jgi:hypothetical protein
MDAQASATCAPLGFTLKLASQRATLVMMAHTLPTMSSAALAVLRSPNAMRCTHAVRTAKPINIRLQVLQRVVLGLLAVRLALQVMVVSDVMQAKGSTAPVATNVMLTGSLLTYNSRVHHGRKESHDRPVLGIVPRVKRGVRYVKK